MSSPVARQGDQVQAQDTHIVLVPTPSGAVVPTPTPMPFAGMLQTGLSTNVKVNGRFVATVGSSAQNQPPHLPIPPTATFAVPPTNLGQVVRGSSKVMVNHKPLARATDPVLTCNDPPGAPTGTIVAGSPDVKAV